MAVLVMGLLPFDNGEILNNLGVKRKAFAVFFVSYYGHLPL